MSRRQIARPRPKTTRRQTQLNSVPQTRRATFLSQTSRQNVCGTRRSTFNRFFTRREPTKNIFLKICRLSRQKNVDDAPEGTSATFSTRSSHNFKHTPNVPRPAQNTSVANAKRSNGKHGQTAAGGFKRSANLMDTLNAIDRFYQRF